MSTSTERLALPVPMRMRTLARDPRGYPIPFIVMLDKAGVAQFTINDQRRLEKVRGRKLCAICGKRLDDGAWFVGGSRCFLHERGAFLDPPAHIECAEYALRVCPFLAAPRYAGRIDDAKLTPGGMPEGMALARAEFMTPDRPEIFGLGHSYAYRFEVDSAGGMGCYVVDAWDYIEWWERGERVNAPASGIAPPDPREQMPYTWGLAR